MKYLYYAITALVCYAGGVYVEQTRTAENVHAVSVVALHFGYVCGAFRDLQCLDDFRK